MDAWHPAGAECDVDVSSEQRVWVAALESDELILRDFSSEVSPCVSRKFHHGGVVKHHLMCGSSKSGTHCAHEDFFQEMRKNTREWWALRNEEQE